MFARHGRALTGESSEYATVDNLLESANVRENLENMIACRALPLFFQSKIRGEIDWIIEYAKLYFSKTKLTKI